MKKVLIITYYWPPSGGAGVQRWLKFAKYLPEYGWEPIILTPENPSFINQDPSLLDEASNIEVLKLPIWEPYGLANKVKGGGHQKDVNLSSRQSMKDRFLLWMRGNIFIPDPRMFWVKPATSFLKEYLKDREVDMIVTTGPPHSMHLVGLKIKKKYNIPWVADFRDPWSQWDLLDKLKVGRWARSKHKRLEKKVLTRADRVLSVGWEMDKGLKSLGALATDVITNGFDPQDFANQPPRSSNQDFVIRHIGSIDELRDPRPFVELVSNLRSDGKLQNVKIEFIGNVTPSVEADLRAYDFVSFSPYIPHEQVIMTFSKTDLLLLVLAHTHSSKLNITGKIFEYIASGCPIIGMGDPDGDAARVLNDSKRGRVFSREDTNGLRDHLLELTSEPTVLEIDKDTSPYSRKNLTEKLAKLFDSILGA